MLGNESSLMQEMVRSIVLGTRLTDFEMGKIVEVNPADNSPVKIAIGEGVILEEADFLLSPLVKDFQVSTTITWNTTETKSTHKHSYIDTQGDTFSQRVTSEEGYTSPATGAWVAPYPWESGDQPNPMGTLSHYHLLIGTQDMLLHFGCKVDDYVLMMNFNGGGRYVVLFKITGSIKE